MSFTPHGLSRLAWLRPIIDHRRRSRAAIPRDHLDAATLRDLAIDRSELDSYLAEALEEAQATRRRIAVLSGCRGGA